MSAQTVVYLDQNKWVELLKAEKSHPTATPEADAALTALRKGVESGAVIVPLSGAHYIETWHRRGWESRHALASLMRDLSGYATVAPIHRLSCMEIESLLLTRYRWHGCACELPDVRGTFMGRGVNHAFASPIGRMREMEPHEAEVLGISGDLSLKNGFIELVTNVAEEVGDAYEWWSLAGGQDSLEYPGFDVRSEQRRGTYRAEAETALSDVMSADTRLQARLDDAIVAEILGQLTDKINRVAFRHGAGTDTLMTDWMRQGPGFGHELLRQLPVHFCYSRLLRAKRRNRQWKWSQHDQLDLLTLAAVVPYSDVVVTERQWTHVLGPASDRPETWATVISRLGDLPGLIS